MRPGSEELSEGDRRSIKSRLFGDEEGDRLTKKMIKARLLRELAPKVSQPTGGIDTAEEGEGNTEPSAAALDIEPVRIGRFAILRKLGRGGMGVVYVAYDETLDRRVAIKILRGELAKDERGQVRMLREAQALARLSHPNVVQVHEVSQWRDHHYVAMEYVEGETLGDWLAQQTRSWQEILDVMIQAGRGLAAAHQVGLVHRDFKPANLLVGKDGRARVLDFGLARAVNELDSLPPADAFETAEHSVVEADSLESLGSTTGSSSSGTSAFDQLLTATGAVLGTPAYMAPEQHLGDSATAASDLFSFCVVLYEALFGRRPFKAKSRTEYAMRVTEGAFQMPGPSSGVPAWLRQAVARGLSPRAEERWPSMEALLAELDRDRVRVWKRLAGAAALVGGVGLALALGGAADDEPELCAVDRSAIEEIWGEEEHAALAGAFAQAGGEQGYVRAITERTLDDYANAIVEARRDSCVDRYIEGAQSDAQMSLRGACLDQRSRELQAVVEQLVGADDEVVRHAPALLGQLGDVGLCEQVELLELGMPIPKDLETVEAIAALRDDIARSHAAREAGRIKEAKALEGEIWRRVEKVEYLPVVGEAHFLAGMNAAGVRNDQIGREHYAEAAAIAQQTGHVELASLAWVELARADALSGSDPDSSLAFKMAASAVQRAGNSKFQHCRLDSATGIAFQRSGRSELAVEAFDRAIELAESGFPGSEHQLAGLLTARSVSHSELGHAAFARADLERVLDMELRGDPHVLDARYNLALVAVSQEDYDEAERQLRNAIASYRDMFGPRHVAIGHAHMALAQIASARGELEGAAEAVEAAGKIIDANHPDHDWVLDGLAAIRVEQRRFAEAEALLRQAIEHRRGRTPEDVHRLGYFHDRLGRAIRAQGRLDDAFASFDEAVALLDHGNSPIELARALLHRGEVRLETGQPLLALESLERAVNLTPIDCGEPRLAARIRIELADALIQVDRGSKKHEMLLRDAKRLLEGLPDTERHLARVDELSQP